MVPDETPLFCDRCSVELTPGAGNFYVVKIEAFADPTPPTLDAEQLSRNHEDAMQTLAVEMQELSGQEALDQVYRRVTLYLCGTCYPAWIEDPTG